MQEAWLTGLMLPEAKWMLSMQTWQSGHSSNNTNAMLMMFSSVRQPKRCRRASCRSLARKLKSAERKAFAHECFRSFHPGELTLLQDIISVPCLPLAQCHLAGYVHWIMCHACLAEEYHAMQRCCKSAQCAGGPRYSAGLHWHQGNSVATADKNPRLPKSTAEIFKALQTAGLGM